LRLGYHDSRQKATYLRKISRDKCLVT